MSRYLMMKVPDLKDELRRRSASTRGRKTDLIERLESYDRNKDFGHEVVAFVDPSLPGWPSEGFRQVTRNHKDLLPDLTEEDLENYFQSNQGKGSKQLGTIKAVEKGDLLVEARRVVACSFTTLEDAVYFSGYVRAAMKKKVSYNFKLKVGLSPTEVLNAHCECPSGRGPTGACKHVAAVLRVLQTFTSTGQLNLPSACTDELQTFHHPTKIYSGSPVKAQDMRLQFKRDEIDLEDPRPLQFRNCPGYQDHVRNHVINYIASTGDDLAIRYLYDSADIQVAAIDHAYTRLPFTQHWVDKRNQLSVEQASLLEAKSRTQAKSALWFLEREWRITASSFGRICRLTKRCNTDKLCASLLHPANLCTPPIRHGRRYESWAISRFENEYNLEVRPSGLYVRPDYAFLGATPDGVIDQDTIVEVKCPYSGRDNLIQPGKRFSFLKLGNDGQLELNPTHPYYYQVQGQLFISKAKLCFFIVYTFKDMEVIAVNIDEEYCVGSLIPKLERFYEQVYRQYVANQL